MKKYTVLLILIAIFALFCACGNTTADDITPTPTAIATPAQTITPTATPTITNTPTSTPSPTITPTPKPLFPNFPPQMSYEVLLFDGEYTQEKLNDFVRSLLIATGHLDRPGQTTEYGGVDFTDDGKLLLYIDKNRERIVKTDDKYIIPVKHVHAFLFSMHLGQHNYDYEYEESSFMHSFFLPKNITFAEYDEENDVLILDELPDTGIKVYDVVLSVPAHILSEEEMDLLYGPNNDHNKYDELDDYFNKKVLSITGQVPLGLSFSSITMVNLDGEVSKSHGCITIHFEMNHNGGFTGSFTITQKFYSSTAIA